ncbi:MAG: hypothetical protein IKL61_01750 [Clostridia bacterium]|nr:hypothetical protein [Clostridia bacterium]
MGAGYHCGFGNTKGSGKNILIASSKTSALYKIKTLPKNLQTSYTKYVKDTTTSKYIDYKITKIGEGYVYQSKKPGNVPGSYAIYYKEVDSNGKTVRVYKDTYDNKGNLIHRKNK